jgi:hypothetical protein
VGGGSSSPRRNMGKGRRPGANSVRVLCEQEGRHTALDAQAASVVMTTDSEVAVEDTPMSTEPQVAVATAAEGEEMDGARPHPSLPSHSLHCTAPQEWARHAARPEPQ